MAVATNDATKAVARSMRSMKEGAQKLSHVPEKRRAAQKNGAGLIPPATSKKSRASSAANKKAGLAKEVDDERAMAEQLAANRAAENEKALQEVAMEDARAILKDSPLATQEITLDRAPVGSLEAAGIGDAAVDFLEEAGIGDADAVAFLEEAGIDDATTFDYNSTTVTAAVQGNTKYDPVPPRKPAFLAMVGNADTTVKGVTGDRLTACQALPAFVAHETVCTMYTALTKKKQEAVAERLYHGHAASPGKNPDLTHESVDIDGDGKPIEWASLSAMFIGMAGRFAPCWQALTDDQGNVRYELHTMFRLASPITNGVDIDIRTISWKGAGPERCKSLLTGAQIMALGKKYKRSMRKLMALAIRNPMLDGVSKDGFYLGAKDGSTTARADGKLGSGRGEKDFDDHMCAYHYKVAAQLPQSSCSEPVDAEVECGNEFVCHQVGRWMGFLPLTSQKGRPGLFSVPLAPAGSSDADLNHREWSWEEPPPREVPCRPSN